MDRRRQRYRTPSRQRVCHVFGSGRVAHERQQSGFRRRELRLWFPPVPGGLWWVKDGQHGRITNDGLDRDVFYSIAGRNDELWVGRQHGGLTQLWNENGSFRPRPIRTRTGSRKTASIRWMKLGTERVWAGTLSGGASKLRGGRFTNYTTANGLRRTQWPRFSKVPTARCGLPRRAA
jgi:hypothetical protein